MMNAFMAIWLMPVRDRHPRVSMHISHATERY
jgi:hypothetical protein